MAGTDPPETKYVAVGDADVAYQVMGDGTFDLVDFYGLGSHVELAWDSPEEVQNIRLLASFSRLIRFDRRGTGASDGVPRNAIPTWEAWTEDLSAVLDAVGSERAAIVAQVDAGPIAALFAATQPERVSALVLSNTSARCLAADDYPIGASPEDAEAVIEFLVSGWGTKELLRITHPALPEDELARAVRTLHACATPRTAAAQIRYIVTSLDVRDALSSVQAPTLVLHNTHNPLLTLDHGRYLAEHIPDGKFIEVPGAGISLGANRDFAYAEVIEFLTGQRDVVEVDRVLTSVMFTDIVASTEKAATLGDRRWRNTLDGHDRLVRNHLRQFRGKEIKTTGDGFCASFDGPARGIRCAQAIVEEARGLGIEIRAGLHTGECEVRGDDLGGLAVHIAARVGALADPSEVLVSGTVKDLVVGSDIEFDERGGHALKGVPGTWTLFAVRA